MKITFASYADHTMPSTRYRALIPAQEMAKQGQQIKLGPPQLGDDVGIWMKHFRPEDQQDIRKFQGRKIFDCCDDHFHNENRNHYINMIENADLVTCTTERMAEIIKDETGAEARVIPDPYEFPENQPHFVRRSRPRLLWYGHSVNFDTIEPWLDELQDYDVKIIANKFPHKLQRDWVRFEPWSHQSMINSLHRCDFVIIPTLNDYRHKTVKSHNRPLEAIRQGRFVVMGHLPSYEQFSGTMWVGDIVEGLEWARKHPELATERVQQAQNYIRSRYSPKVIAEHWLRACDPSRGN